MITTSIEYTHPSTDPTHHPKRHPDRISRFATVHFLDTQTDTQTDKWDRRQLNSISTYALVSDALTRSPAVARMADRTAPVVKLTLTLTLTLTGHNLAKTGTFH